MAKSPRLSEQTLQVISAFMDNPGSELSGADIAKHAGLASGTLYPILARLEQYGWVKGYWEIGDPAQLGRPRRRFYSLTPVGAKNVREVSTKLRPLFGVLSKPI